MEEKTIEEAIIERINNAASKETEELDLIDLSNNTVQPKPIDLPREIGQLINLKSLKLRYIKLNSLPKEFRQLTNLTSLDLSYCELTNIPTEIGKLSHLTSLYLRGNNLENLPDEIWGLNKLTLLALSDNKISNLPDEIKHLVNLISLELSYNQLASLPAGVGQLEKLKELNLNKNRISSLPNEIGKLGSLTSLDLSDNQLDELPSELWQLINLKSLNLNENLLNHVPDKIKYLTKLTFLGLKNNQINSLPPEIGQLANLESLELGKNPITTLPSEFSHLSKLKSLSIIYHRLGRIPPEVLELRGLRHLSIAVSHLDHVLTTLPSEIGTLNKLETLDLSFNKLSSLPAEIGLLTELKNLHLEQNDLTDLPTEIGHLTKLKLLDLSHNNLTYLPSTICSLTELKELYVSNNQLTVLPSKFDQLMRLEYVNLNNNNLGIPPEITLDSKNISKIIYYIKLSSKRKPLHESKILVVGQGSVGKTSLIKRLVSDEFFSGELKTEGISVNKWNVPLSDSHDSDRKQQTISTNIWDFGGQEIMHAAHQFFFTTRSLYLLVLDNRLTSEENRVDYWLKIIQAFGKNAPVLIVGNKSDQHLLDIDRTNLYKNYHNVKNIIETSAASGTGIEELRSTLTDEINKLPHVRDLLPNTWFTIKTKLEELGHQSNFITYDKYLELCAENEVNDETSQRMLIGFLHDLGIILHFQDDPRLESLGILNPQWVTNGVYKILNSHTLFQNKGALTVTMLDEILNLPEYPRGKRLFIVDMMKKFELCYDIEPDKTFLVPDLLPKDEPADLKFSGFPAFEYAYPVLPSSVITRFIVRMNRKIDGGLVWRTGVVLKIGDNIALVKADIEDRKITIAIDGLEYTRREAIFAIRYELGEIHNSIKGLNPQQRVPIPNAPNAEPLEYDYLLMLEREGQETHLVKDGSRLVKFNVREVLSAIENESQRKETGGNVTNIYIGGDVNGGNIISGNNNVVTQSIQNSFNKADSADIQAELKATLKQLADAVAVMAKSLPDEQATETTDDLSKLVDEATKPKPNKKWYSVSIDGLIKAAENVEKVGEPVINLSRKVLSLLTAGLITE